MKFDRAEERDSSLVFAPNIGKNTYVYLEELQALNGFEFYPADPIDIEKPATVSPDQLFLWRLPLGATNDNKPGHVKSVQQLNDNTVKIETAFDYHLRY